MLTVITSVGLEKDYDAPQVFNFSRVLEVRDFLAQAPRTGWVAYGEKMEFVSAGVTFKVFSRGEDVTDQIVAEGWLQNCEVTR